MSKNNISFIDLQSQKKRLGGRIEQAIQKVLEHGGYIMGPEVFALEKQLSEYCGAKHTISCSNGTDALALVLMAKGIKAGDAVFVPAFTFAATAEVVAYLGATPVFIDVLPDTFNIDPDNLEKGIGVAKELGLTPRALIPVDLFGQPADYDVLKKLCEKHGLWFMSDAAQSFGASYKGKKVGTFGLATATSFYPAKPLGCYGDGGAIFTDDDDLAALLRSIRVHGQGNDKYDNVRIGVNGRLDTIQAAILIEKLAILEEEMLVRQKIAQYYSDHLKDVVTVPVLTANTTSAWAQYTICLKNQNRDKVVKSLESQGIPTAIHYPKPLHKQLAFKHYPTAGTLYISEMLADNVLSLPMHPYLDLSLQEQIIAGVKEAVVSEQNQKERVSDATSA
jgi:dTDP-4-amino-4,6-dideoxygalactose transaminase